MAINPTTPGVYINEVNAFPNSIVGVATAIPAFIGFTEKTEFNNKSALLQPTKISSLQEYESIFGGAPTTTFSIVDEPTPTKNSFVVDGKNYSLKIEGGNYLLYNQLQLFFANGGNVCYIVSIGNYEQPILENDFVKGINCLSNTSDVTLLVCPEAVLLDDVNNYAKVAQEMLLHCNTAQNCFSILDVYSGDQALDSGIVESYRNALGNAYLKYGASYYPYLNTTIAMPDQLCYTQITNEDKLAELLNTQIGSTPLEKLKEQMDEANINQYLLVYSKVYYTISNAMSKQIGTQPSSGIMAGIYTATDNSNGVWRAPANVGVEYATDVTVNINDDEQAGLNVDVTTGKSINAIRKFTGRGIVVWGAKTLDGNSYDWRYIPVRRLITYVEQSIKLATDVFVFAPNTPHTWASVKSMCESFLTQLWQQGAFAGAKASDAFSVDVGEGTTMTSIDVLNGLMIISIAIAPSHPAEFIIITIQHQMQRP